MGRTKHETDQDCPASEPEGGAAMNGQTLSRNQFSRRQALLLGSAFAGLSLAPAWAASGLDRAQPLPMKDVRLTPSIWADAVEANRRYILTLEPDRLLHNFRTSAGLSPKGAVYAGWESMGIAGHTLGHYLTALALMHAQTGDAECLTRARYVIGELAVCQAAHGDGYIGGTTVTRDGREVDGKIVFEEVRRHDIRTEGFDINGGWVPLYTWHKVHAGLLDVHEHCGDPRALAVAVAACGYLAGVFDGLSDAEVQKVLAAEHGGINETLAETYARTQDPRWLALAQRLRHKAVLDPLTEQRDQLAGLHANTQIPKVIGLARLHELTGDPGQATASEFFWRTVTQNHSYVIGGNSEREHFSTPGTLKGRLTDKTCEACNTYNMLKLTRHLYARRPDPAYFDYYERAHLNHIMSHQDPETGMFTYFTPTISGGARNWSSPTEDFWCCLGTGIESHAKHGDSIYWRSGETLIVNLFIPSRLDWKDQGLKVELDTRFPDAETVTLRILAAKGSKPRDLALRLPAWAADPSLRVNGQDQPLRRVGGYGVVTRRWRAGDTVVLTLPMRLQTAPLPDAPDVVAFTHGPVVLAADLGPATVRFDGAPPALVTEDPLTALTPVGGQPHVFRTSGQGRPSDLTLRPFFSQRHQRTAIYLPTFTEARWRAESGRFAAEQQARLALERRTIDVVHLGEMQPERDHQLTSGFSEPTAYMARSGRALRSNGYFECVLTTRPGAVLAITQWGDSVSDAFTIRMGDQVVPAAPPPSDRPKAFVETLYPLPPGTGSRLVLRITAKPGAWVSIYELRVLEPEERPAATAT